MLSSAANLDGTSPSVTRRFCQSGKLGFFCPRGMGIGAKPSRSAFRVASQTSTTAVVMLNLRAHCAPGTPLKRSSGLSKVAGDFRSLTYHNGDQSSREE